LGLAPGGRIAFFALEKTCFFLFEMEGFVAVAADAPDHDLGIGGITNLP